METTWGFPKIRGTVLGYLRVSWSCPDQAGARFGSGFGSRPSVSLIRRRPCYFGLRIFNKAGSKGLGRPRAWDAGTLRVESQVAEAWEGWALGEHGQEPSS